MNQEMITTIPFRTFQKGSLLYSIVLFAMGIVNVIILWGVSGEGVRISPMTFWMCYRVESLIILGMFIICIVMTRLNVQVSDFGRVKSRDGGLLSPHNCVMINQLTTYVTFVTFLAVDYEAYLTVSMTVDIYALGFIGVNVIFFINNGCMLLSKPSIQRVVNIIK